MSLTPLLDTVDLRNLARGIYSVNYCVGKINIAITLPTGKSGRILQPASFRTGNRAVLTRRSQKFSAISWSDQFTFSRFRSLWLYIYMRRLNNNLSIIFPNNSNYRKTNMLFQPGIIMASIENSVARQSMTNWNLTLNCHKYASNTKLHCKQCN